MSDMAGNVKQQPASWQRSRELFEEAKQSLASGVASSLRLAIKPTPLFVKYGRGSHLFDMDGNEYIDYTLAYGPLILGHAHPAIVNAVHGAALRGTTFGAQHESEIKLSRLLCQYVPNADLVCLSGSGTEAVMLAVRLARAHTGRDKVIRFAGHYHGWSDSIFTTFESQASDDWVARPGTKGQSPAALANLIVLPWNDAEVVARALEANTGEVAALICEPVLCNSGCILPRAGYLQALSELTRRHGTLLIFDEVITGFRLGLGGAQERYGVHADLAIFGKALSGGLPLSAVTGRGEIMDPVIRGVVTHLGTFNGNTVSTAAAVATLHELSRDGGAAFLHLGQLGERLARGLRGEAAEAGVPLVVNSAGSVFSTIFSDLPQVSDFAAYQQRDVAKSSQFAELLLREGVYVRPNGLWYVSTAHSDADVDFTLQAVRKVLPTLRA